MLNVENSLLNNIKADVEAVIANDNQAPSTYIMSDKLRHDILGVLFTYSNKIPHPASANDNKGNTTLDTLSRWQILAYVAGIDLTLAKWFESHLDALSILNELGYEHKAQGLWAVWAAEGHPLSYQQGKVNGMKAWCSGANIVDYGLLTYRDNQGHSQLLIVTPVRDKPHCNSLILFTM